MTETLNTPKSERINEISNAATNTEEKKDMAKEEQPKTKPNKNIMLRQIGYPASIGLVGGLIGYTIAEKINKHKTVLVVGSVLFGATIGFIMFNRFKNKQDDK